MRGAFDYAANSAGPCSGWLVLGAWLVLDSLPLCDVHVEATACDHDEHLPPGALCHAGRSASAGQPTAVLHARRGHCMKG